MSIYLLSTLQIFISQIFPCFPSNRSVECSGMKALDKLYYSIREVSDITGIEAYTLRYWEKEFPKLKPKKSRTGQRNYIQKDIVIVEAIKTLLYEQKFTIKGAREKLKKPLASQPSTEKASVSSQKVSSTPASSSFSGDLADLKKDIRSIKEKIKSLLKEEETISCS